MTLLAKAKAQQAVDASTATKPTVQQTAQILNISPAWAGVKSNLPTWGNDAKVETDATPPAVADDAKAPEVPGSISFLECTESGIAESLGGSYSQHFRQVYESGDWLVLNDSGVWVTDTGNKSRSYIASAVAVAIQAETQAMIQAGENAEARKQGLQRIKQFSKMRGRRELDNIRELLKDQPAITIRKRELNSDPWAVAFNNGIIFDLKRNEAHKIEPSDLIHQTLNVPYVAGASCDLWQRCMDQWFADCPEVIGLLQRFFGYCMSGLTREEKLLFFYGKGRNGKGTITKTVETLFGDLSTSWNETVLSHSKSAKAGPNSEVAKAADKLLAISTELSPDLVMYEAFIKKITGGDRFSIEDKFEKSQDIEPRFKLILCGNALPVVKGQDKGIWSRFLTIPFLMTFDDSKRDNSLKERILAELPGIAQWMLAGWQEYQVQGLQVPAVVTKATDEYKSEMDLIGQFLDEDYKRDKAGTIPKADLYAAYKTWAESRGAYVLADSMFGRDLGGRGFGTKQQTNRTTKKRQWVYTGIRRLTDDERKAAYEEALQAEQEGC